MPVQYQPQLTRRSHIFPTQCERAPASCRQGASETIRAAGQSRGITRLCVVSSENRVQLIATSTTFLIFDIERPVANAQ